MKIILLLIAVSASAEQTIQPRDFAVVLYQRFSGAGLATSIQCPGDATDECVVNWTPKAGVDTAFVDKEALRLSLLAELGVIEDKLDAGTATLADARRAIKIIIILTRNGKAP